MYDKRHEWEIGTHEWLSPMVAIVASLVDLLGHRPLGAKRGVISVKSSALVLPYSPFLARHHFC